MRKKVVITVILTILILGAFIAALFKLYLMRPSGIYTDPEGISYGAMVDSESFYFYQQGKWQKEFIKGVNLGAAKPGAFPGEFAIKEDEYLRWFKYISDMNANTIRVYTILKPEFYNALYEYNKDAKKPIYLLQGVWVNEEDIAAIGDAQNTKIKDGLKKDIKNVTDIIHGNCYLPEQQGHASGVYTKDISDYVLGWILGIEWAPDFVEKTDKLHTGMENYTGKYLYAIKASPFENFLCEIGDYSVEYETNTYKTQRPVSFTNWVTTDLLQHPNEPLSSEDIAVVNTEHIKAGKHFKPGLFASYHIYPYYPDSMSYQEDYKSFKDSNGKINTYRAYLKSLKKEHTVPVLVAEFGVPASRGMAHTNIQTGFNQGNIDEKTQGEMDASMLSDIYAEGYAGGLVFSWQDEWFKRTWNTMALDIPDRRPFWSNPQTNEQEFGLLAFDPGETKAASYVDGDPSEWGAAVPVGSETALRLYAASDEKYIYFLVDTLQFNLDKDVLLIPIDSIPNQGSTVCKEYRAGLRRPADFVIAIAGKDNSRVMVDAYYDSFNYLYSKQLNMISPDPNFDIVGSGVFNKEYLCLNKEMYLPQDKTKVPFSKYETGKLRYGDGNPQHKEYSSLADFNVNGGTIEIRIPWQLLNVMDPSKKMVMEDLHTKGISPAKVDGFYVGAILMKNGVGYYSTEMNLFSWKAWDMPSYHERLKPSYYILKEAFGNIGQ